MRIVKVCLPVQNITFVVVVAVVVVWEKINFSKDVIFF